MSSLALAKCVASCRFLHCCHPQAPKNSLPPLGFVAPGPNWVLSASNGNIPIAGWHWRMGKSPLGAEIIPIGGWEDPPLLDEWIPIGGWENPHGWLKGFPSPDGKIPHWWLRKSPVAGWEIPIAGWENALCWMRKPPLQTPSPSPVPCHQLQLRLVKLYRSPALLFPQQRMPGATYQQPLIFMGALINPAKASLLPAWSGAGCALHGFPAFSQVQSTR